MLDVGASVGLGSSSAGGEATGVLVRTFVTGDCVGSKDGPAVGSEMGKAVGEEVIELVGNEVG